MNTLDKLMKYVDKYFIVLTIIMAVIIFYLNFYGHIMLVVYPYYVDFKNIILSGFDPNAAKLGNPTFPMWGYGWLLILTENKIILITIQFSIAIFSVWYLVRFIKNNKIFSNNTILLFKIIIIIAIPWYSFHSIRWPYSISASLVLLAIIIFAEQFFYKPLAKSSVYKIVLSGLLFGIALNFRSDYYILPIALIILVLIFSKPLNIYWIKSALWFISIYIFLLPWGLYTKSITGHFLLTSTNAGHVFFVGLGDLPTNKWGIQPVDNDSILHALIRKKYGKSMSTLTYESNVFLKKEFIKRVKEDPKEYMKKCWFVLKQLPFSGVYPGEFYNEEYLKLQKADEYWIIPGQNWNYERQYDKFLDERKSSNGIVDKILNDFSLRILVEIFSLYIGKILILFSFLFLPLSLWHACKSKNMFLIISLGFIIYQILINVFAFNYRCYTSNVFLMHIINFTYGVFVLISIIKVLPRHVKL